MKCKLKRGMVECKASLTKKGSNIIKGKCPQCGGGMAKIVSADQAAQFKKTAKK